MGVDMSCPIAIPPSHQQRAVSFVDVGGYFQHGGPILPEDR